MGISGLSVRKGDRRPMGIGRDDIVRNSRLITIRIDNGNVTLERLLTPFLING